MIIDFIKFNIMKHKQINKEISLIEKRDIYVIDQIIHNYMAGRFIGTLERIVILIFITIGQYSAIGLVLTAKSIARYDEIAKNKITAEYYLLGTLLSTVFVIILSFLNQYL